MSRPALGCAAFAFLHLLLVHTCYGQDTDPTAPEPEARPVFRAGDLLERSLLRGPNYTIDEKVQLVDDHYRFTMHTRYGDLSILGRKLLDQRVHEMYAVERLRQIGMEPQIIAGALETVRNTPRGLGVLLSDPAGALLRAPRGLRRMVRGAVDPDRAGSQTRRQLAVQLNCDPETTNPILSSQLDSVAGRRSLGRVLSKVGMSVALPGLGLVPLTAEIKDVVVSSTPAQINAHVQARLETLGVEEDLAHRFIRHPHYTTMRRLEYTNALERLPGVDGLDALLEGAVAAENENEAVEMIEAARMLGQLRGPKPVAIAQTGLLHATLNDGSHLLLVTGDYVTLRSELTEAIGDHRSEFPEAHTLLVAMGRVSAEAAATLESAQVAILENATVERLTAMLEGDATPSEERSDEDGPSSESDDRSGS